MDFTLKAYTDLIGSLLRRGYQISSFAETQAAAPHLILRHDVDFDLDVARRMAETESREGWQAFYFVLLRSEFYNPLSNSGRHALMRLGELGHEVGLHFDATLHDGDALALVRAAEHECRLLEGLTGRPVKAFSLHRPRPDLLDNEIEIPGRINAYGSRYFREIGYCSDSRGEWRYGHPIENPAIVEGRALQLLTHPIWWLSEPGTPVEKCLSFLERRRVVLETEMSGNVSIPGLGHLT